MAVKNGGKKNASKPVRLRPEKMPQDEAFLLQLFTEARAHIFDPMPLPPAQKQMLITQQFHTQRFSYKAEFSNPAPSFDIILQNSRPIGRLYIQETPERLHIIDIALLEAVRGRGIGGKLLERLIKRAHNCRKTVSLSVETDRPARRLYERLGFTVVEEGDPYIKMQLAPPKG